MPRTDHDPEPLAVSGPARPREGEGVPGTPRNPPSRILELRGIDRSFDRFPRILREDVQLCFHRADRDRLLRCLEETVRERPRDEAVPDARALAPMLARRVITRSFKLETRELLEDAIRYRVWSRSDQKALVAALMLAGPGQGGGGDDSTNPLWLSILSQSIEDVLRIDDPSSLRKRGEERAPAEERPKREANGYLLQQHFRAAHRAARLISTDALQIVIPLFEILPMFVRVFRVWAQASDYGRQPVEDPTELHEDVLRAYHLAAEASLTGEVEAAIGRALEEAAERQELRAQPGIQKCLLLAAQYCGTVPWQSNPIASQLVLKLCSGPELCCVGPGAAEGLRLAGDPTVAAHFHGYGRALLRHGETRGARRVFEAALDQLGESWQTLLDLALAHRAAGDEELARELARRALECPDLPPQGRAEIDCEMAGITRGLRVERL